MIFKQCLQIKYNNKKLGRQKSISHGAALADLGLN